MEANYKEIEPFLSGNKRMIKGRILDIGCGGGLLSLWLESKGYSIVGIDNNKKMIKIALGEKKKLKFKSEFKNADAGTVKLDKMFDSFTMFGNTLANISLISFVKIMRNLNKNLRKKGNVLISYNDSLKSVLRDQYSISTSDNFLNINGNYSHLDNSIELIRVSFKGKGMVKFKMYVWSSQILQALMLSLGFKLVKSMEIKAEMVTNLDVYQKMRDGEHLS